LIIAGSLLNGCDVCSTNNNVTVEEGDIYFSAIPVNRLQPSIYRIDTDGKNFREVTKNGMLFSPPSSNKKIVYLEEYLEGKFVVLSDISGLNPKQIGDNSWTGKSYSVLSPDGKYVAVVVGLNDLWLITVGSGYQKITNKICQNTLPVFSPDGKKLAFYEGRDFSAPLTVKVFDLNSSSPVLVSQASYPTGINPWYGEATIDWSKDGKSLTYIISPDTLSDLVYITEWDNPDNSTSYQISTFGAFEPVLSPDRQQIAFAGRDGNIWIKNLASTAKKNITNVTSKLQYNLYPQWSSDGKKIIFSTFFNDDKNVLHGTLHIAEDLETDSPSIKVLSNNVYRGFWNKK